LTDTKHPTFSSNHLADIGKTNQQQQKTKQPETTNVDTN